MSEGPITPRRWLSFSIRTLLLVIAIIGGWLGWNIRTVRERDQMAAWIVAQGGYVTNGPPRRPWSTLPWLWSLLGAEPVSVINMETNSTFTRGDLHRAEALFPEAEIIRRPALQ